MSAEVLGCLLLAITEPTDRALAGWHVPYDSLPQFSSRGFSPYTSDFRQYCDLVAGAALEPPVAPRAAALDCQGDS